MGSIILVTSGVFAITLIMGAPSTMAGAPHQMVLLSSAENPSTRWTDADPSPPGPTPAPPTDPSPGPTDPTPRPSEPIPGPEPPAPTPQPPHPLPSPNRAAPA